LRHRVESLNEIGAEIEFDFSGGEQQPVVGVGAALQNRHIEPVFLISSVGLGLIEPAMLGFRKPVGRESDLVEGKRRGCYKSKSEEENETGFQCESSITQCSIRQGSPHDSNNRGKGVANLNLDSRPRQELQVEPETAARRIAPNTTPTMPIREKTKLCQLAKRWRSGSGWRAKGRISSAREGSINRTRNTAAGSPPPSDTGTGRLTAVEVAMV
jgi:hypothetical protein